MFHVIRYSAQVIQQELHLPKRKRTQPDEDQEADAQLGGETNGQSPKINFAFVFDPFH
jgi:hypothetical protein